MRESEIPWSRVAVKTMDHGPRASIHPKRPLGFLTYGDLCLAPSPVDDGG